MSHDEFPPDNFGVYAPDLRVTKLDASGEPLFTVSQGCITFHQSGVYEIKTPATVRRVDLAAEGDYPEPEELEEDTAPEVLAAARQGLALGWLKDGTLNLAELAAAVGMDVRGNVLTITPDLADQLQEAEERNTRQADLVTRIGRFLHLQSNRLQGVAEALQRTSNGLPRKFVGSEFYTACDIMVHLREVAISECGVPWSADYPRVGEVRADGGQHVVPSNVPTQLAARQDSLPEVWLHHHDGRSRIVKCERNASSVHLELLPDELASEPDDEAVRRLAHAMTEVANRLEVIRGTAAQLDKLRPLVHKLRETVTAWTTEQQRRSWAQAASSETAAPDMGSIGETMTAGGIPFPLDAAEGYDTAPSGEDVSPGYEDIHNASNHRCRCGKLDKQSSPGCAWHERRAAGGGRVTREQCATKGGCRRGVGGEPLSKLVARLKAELAPGVIAPGTPHRARLQQLLADLMEAEALQRSHESGGSQFFIPADLPDHLHHTLVGLLDLLENNRGRWLGKDAANADELHWRLREFLRQG